MNDQIEFVDIKDTDTLVKFLPQIQSLFLECFDKPLPDALWEWAYLNNPCGQPLVSLAIVNGSVVGHYAVIPQSLNNSSKTLNGYLSMTTMVSAPYRRFGLFQLLAERVYSRIETTLVPSVVYGFPNDNSTAGFRKRLGWTILEQYQVIQVTPKDWHHKCKLIKKCVTAESYHLDMNHDDIRVWRCNKPGQTWTINNGVGLKEINGVFDLMYYSDVDTLSNIVSNKPINIISPQVVTDEVNGESETLFPYRFGFRAFNMQEPPSFFVQMCMSDVF
ncbi:GNAT family N-acetyltransferase [Aeromonas hydrophila]|uniref:GNAT family N-acetyltransferase n=1 Tax=Aeromonas hydrophila TaxID=644 RepID=A0AAX3P3E9_AERHY|nr:GNAT family N-acetyltransferase [Aeromonas hydrophila]WEE24643.1 GNAT family N-acetyltransferase [Aeromonas hydrophila]